MMCCETHCKQVNNTAHSIGLGIDMSNHLCEVLTRAC